MMQNAAENLTLFRFAQCFRREVNAASCEFGKICRIRATRNKGVRILWPFMGFSALASITR